MLTMNIQEYANLPENQDGFFVEKWRNNRYFVYHRGWAVLSNSISVAKDELRVTAKTPTLRSGSFGLPSLHLSANFKGVSVMRPQSFAMIHAIADQYTTQHNTRHNGKDPR